MVKFEEFRGSSRDLAAALCEESGLDLSTLSAQDALKTLSNLSPRAQKTLELAGLTASSFSREEVEKVVNILRGLK